MDVQKIILFINLKKKKKTVKIFFAQSYLKWTGHVTPLSGGVIMCKKCYTITQF